MISSLSSGIDGHVGWAAVFEFAQKGEPEAMAATSDLGAGVSEFVNVISCAAD